MTEIQIKNTLNKKLKKVYHVLVPYQAIDKRIDEVVKKIQKNYKVKGFRPGQVPTDLIKQKHGSSIMAEESEKIINENSRKIVEDNKLKLALSPKIEVKVFEPNKDFEYTVTIDIFPEVPEIELNKIKLKKFEVEISQSDISDSIKKITKSHIKWNEQDSSYKSKIGDAVNIDYVGTIDKKVFEGGSANGYQLELGSKTFIDNFEEQLVGKRAGDKVKVKVKFPKDYQKQEFAGKAAEFEVKINSVLSGENPDLNDEFIKNNFGLDNLAKLEEIAKQQLDSGYKSMARNLFKEGLFEFLNKKYDFELPSGLVDEHFDKIWQQTKKNLDSDLSSKTQKEQEKAIEKAKEKDREKSEKMVRSGIILSEIRKKHNIQVSKEDLDKEIRGRLSQFPGQEQIVIKYYQENPEALENLKAIILEEKLVDLIIDKSNLENKKLSVKDFEKISKD